MLRQHSGCGGGVGGGLIELHAAGAVAEADPTGRRGATWVVLDGNVDPESAQSLSSVLDDTRLLTLPPGERLPLPASVQLVLEFDGLPRANSSTVSQCGMIRSASSGVPLGAHLARVVAVVEDGAPGAVAALAPLFDWGIDADALSAVAAAVCVDDRCGVVAGVCGGVGVGRGGGDCGGGGCRHSAARGRPCKRGAGAGRGGVSASGRRPRPERRAVAAAADVDAVASVVSD